MRACGGTWIAHGSGSGDRDVVDAAADDIGGDEEVHFLRQAVQGEAFDALAEGMTVEIDVVETAAGYMATRVVPLRG